MITKSLYLPNDLCQNKADFISYMSTWVLKSKEETSIMHDMIKI